MSKTPDRFPGEVDEEGSVFEEGTEDPTAEGGVRYVNGAFRARDESGVFNLRSGSGLSEASHKILRQLIHFIDDKGPAEGFTSGAYREITGTLFPSKIIWWESNEKLKKILSKEITWSGVFPSIIVWKIYNVDGSTVLASVTDSITYSGPFETSRIRVIE